jgi:hypothetical protein
VFAGGGVDPSAGVSEPPPDGPVAMANISAVFELALPSSFFAFAGGDSGSGAWAGAEGSAAASSALGACSSFAAIFAPAVAAGTCDGSVDAPAVVAWPSELASGTSPPPHPVTMKHAPAIPRRANQVVQGFMGPRSFQNFP